jgi:hypothetical protein
LGSYTTFVSGAPASKPLLKPKFTILVDEKNRTEYFHGYCLMNSESTLKRLRSYADAHNGVIHVISKITSRRRNILR